MDSRPISGPPENLAAGRRPVHNLYGVAWLLGRPVRRIRDNDRRRDRRCCGPSEGPEHAQVDAERNARIWHTARGGGGWNAKYNSFLPQRDLSVRDCRAPVSTSRALRCGTPTSSGARRTAANEFGLHAKNIADKKYIIGGYNFLAQNPLTGDFLLNADRSPIPTLGRTGVLTAYYGNPRQVFLSAAVNF